MNKQRLLMWQLGQAISLVAFFTVLNEYGFSVAFPVGYALCVLVDIRKEVTTSY